MIGYSISERSPTSLKKQINEAVEFPSSVLELRSPYPCLVNKSSDPRVDDEHRTIRGFLWLIAINLQLQTVVSLRWTKRSNGKLPAKVARLAAGTSQTTRRAPPKRDG